MLIKAFTADTLKVRMYATRRQMGAAAAADAAACLKTLLAEQERVRIIFAAAPSQNEFLEELAAASDIDWSRVHALHMDEYIGLPDDAPQGFGNFLRRAFFDRVALGSVAYIGSGDDAEARCAAYAELLAEPVDLVFMGIGENGHIAFNDPHVADFHDPAVVKIVSLDSRCRMQQVHDGCFASLDEVPTHALTLTIPTLCAARRIFCIVPAATKADAVHATVCGPITEFCPASILRRHADATLYLDADSGKQLLTTL